MRRERALGFTLIELALVILLISIFLGLGLSALGVQQTNRAFSETREKQETIKDALVTYLANFRRLPCPDTDLTVASPPDGNENRVGGVPTGACLNLSGVPIIPAFGVIPYATLGLSRDDALDGWDNFFSYQVSLDNGVGVTPENEEWSLTPTPAFPTAFAVGNAGSITLKDRDAAGVETTLNNPPPLGLGIAAIIVSHGRNGSGAFTTKGAQNLAPTASDELDNTDANSVFFRREFTDVDVPNGGPFDDLVLALTPSDLLTPAIKDGALQSAMGQVREQLIMIRDTAFGQVPGSTPPCTPPANLAALVLPDTVTTDPWGQQINYFRANPGPLTTPPAPTLPSPAPGTHAFCVWSSGPNGDNNSVPLPPPNCPPIADDDVGLAPVTYDQLRTAYPASVCP